MATVSKWNPFGVALNVTATAGTVTRTSATQYTVKINVSWKTYWSGNTTNYGMTASSGGGSATINTFGKYASSGSGSFTGTYSISGNGSASKTITVTFRNFNNDNGDSATKSVSLAVTVPAWTSYKVQYSANGGSGSPSAQTKWKDQTLTLSSTKPTRTGYSFLGWSSSSTATTATYSAGGKYTANSAITLYAVWKANTYTITYNANGGTGAPSSQTKTYGVALTLSSTKPTRTNYNFIGWGTSASATTVIYAAGASYTANASITLYAIWKLAYAEPRITNYSVTRCDSDGSSNSAGTYALVKFNYACDKTVSSIVIAWEVPGVTGTSGTTTITASDTSGSVNEVIGSGNLNADYTYTIRVTVEDSGGSTYKDKTLNGDVFIIDCLPENKGVAFGKPAEKSGYADFKYKTYHRDNSEYENNKYIRGMDTDGNSYAALIPVTESGNLSLGYGLYSAEKGATNIYGNKVNFYTKDGVYVNGNNLYMNNTKVIYGANPDGTFREVFAPQNTNGNLVIGHGLYSAGNGNTNLYGHDINYGVSNIANPGVFRPYRRRGDSLTTTFYTTGYCTNSKSYVIFHLPFTVPIVGSPTISVSSGNGFILRQDDKYTHGSNGAASPSVYAIPDSYTVNFSMWTGITITAKFSTVTNAVNNSPIGIQWNGTVTFS